MELKRNLPTPNVLFLFFLGGLLLLHFYLPLRLLFTFPVTLLGIGLVLLGVWLNLRANDVLSQHGTSVEPFKRPTALVTVGPFRFSRNPVYLSAVLQLLGVALFLGSLSPLLVPLLWLLVLDRIYVPQEEAVLQETFGDAYRTYRQRVRRWL